VTRTSPATASTTRGRQPESIEAIEKVALELFRERGFEETPVEDIAAAAGISRRTFFRYFGSKNDVVFGNFELLLQDFEEWLASQPDERPMFEVIADATMQFNRVHSDGPAAHRERMELILHTPALRANAALRNAEWLAVVVRYAARRMDAHAEDLGPQLAGHVALGAANAAYEQWLHDESSDLDELVHRAFTMVEVLPDTPAKRGTSRARARP
jgi:TetR/AcrR family transcriptional regulator, regulator of mycofactocin system